MSVASLRSGLQANLATISGLRVEDYVPGSVAAPAALIQLDGVTYRRAHQNGLHEYDFTVRVLVASTYDRTSQAALDAYMDPSHANSVQAAIESDRTLGGAADDCLVVSVGSVGLFGHGNVEYLGAEFDVTAWRAT